MLFTSHDNQARIAVARTRGDLEVTATGRIGAVEPSRGKPISGRSYVLLSTRFEGVIYRCEVWSDDLFEPSYWPDQGEHEIEIDGRAYDAHPSTPLPRPVKAAFDAALSGVCAWMTADGVSVALTEEWGLAKTLTERQEAAKARRKARR